MRRRLRQCQGVLPRLRALLGLVCWAWLGAVSSEGGPFRVEERTIAEIQSALLDRTLTARQLVQAYLDRIEAFDQKGPAIRCIISLDPSALSEADRLDAELARQGKLSGPLHGVVVLVKDEIDVAGTATTHGVRIFANYRPPRDAFVVERLRRSGAIILGKTTLSEFAGGDTYSTLFGHSRNPYALDRTVGGSSGGSGGAVAANFSTVALGEETSSSLKRPAAWCALAGMRPTPGLISRSGMWDGHPVPTAQMGPMARTVADMAKLLDGMVGYDAEDPITAFGVRHTPPTYTAYLDPHGLRGARLGAVREPLGSNSRPDAADFQRVEAVFAKALDSLRQAGATVIDVVIPELKELSAKRATDAALTAEALSVYLKRNPQSEFRNQADIDNHPEMPNTFKAISGQRRRRGLSNVSTTDPALILESIRAREKLLQNVAQVMAEQHLDALVFKSVEHEPSLITEATQPPYRSNGGVVSLNTFLIHTPIITVPMGYSDGTIPAGLTFMGLPFSEPVLIRLGYAYEQATRHRRPPTSTPVLPVGVLPSP